MSLTIQNSFADSNSVKSDDIDLMLRDSANAWVKSNLDFKRTRASMNVIPGYDFLTYQKMAEMGWCGILIPEQYGGSGLGLSSMAVVLEELACGLLVEPLLATSVMAGEVILHSESESSKAVLLPSIAATTIIPALAWQEKINQKDMLAISSTAQQVDDIWILNGVKRMVVGASSATGFIFSALNQGNFEIFWVDAQEVGLSMSHEWRIDGSSISTLTAVNVKASDHLASGSCAQLAIETAIEKATILACAEICGLINTIMDITLDYMRVRHQFGKPIGSFQVLQHKLVDLFIQQQLTSAVLKETLNIFSNTTDISEKKKIVSRLKARASSSVVRIARESIQLHGAIAIQDECNIGLFLKRALVLSAWLGNTVDHRRRFLEISQ